MKYFLFLFKYIFSTLFAYLAFPKSCGICNEISYEMPLCAKCRKKLLEFKIENRCNLCGKELFFEKDLCTKCREEKKLTKDFASLYPIFPYVLQKKYLLYSWKVANNREMVFFFAKVVFKVLNEKYPKIPIVPIPPRKNKIAEKGWDQIEDLVFILERKYKIPVFRLLSRENVLQQKKLSKEKRLTESKKSYKVIENLDLLTIPKEIVLLDDVITTGATLNSCKTALEELGIEKIHGVSLFSVP